MTTSFQTLINNASQDAQFRNDKAKLSDPSISYETIKVVQGMQKRMAHIEEHQGSLEHRVHNLERAKL
jgi:hypothetical protein